MVWHAACILGDFFFCLASLQHLILSPSCTWLYLTGHSILCVLSRLFFWTDRTRIYMRTLSGIMLDACHTPSSGASSLAVDTSRQNLYWLSNSATSSQRWKISQLDYSGIHCNTTRYGSWILYINAAIKSLIGDSGGQLLCFRSYFKTVTI